MLVRFENARVLDSGFYEITEIGGAVARYPWVELIQPRNDLAGLTGWPARDSVGSQRFSVEIVYDRKAGLQVGGAPLFEGVPFGTLISGYAEVSDQTKVIKGTDRSVDQIKFKIVGWTPAGSEAGERAGSNGKAERPVVAAV